MRHILCTVQGPAVHTNCEDGTNQGCINRGLPVVFENASLIFLSMWTGGGHVLTDQAIGIQK